MRDRFRHPAKPGKTAGSAVADIGTEEPGHMEITIS